MLINTKTYSLNESDAITKSIILIEIQDDYGEDKTVSKIADSIV